MKNHWTTAIIALFAGSVGALLTLALTTTKNVAKASVSRIEEPSSTSSKEFPTVIEHQVSVHDPVSTPSARAAEEKETLAPKVNEPVDVAADLESMFQDDHVSAAGARKSESELRTAFGNPRVKGVKVDRIDCKAETCRIELTFDNRQADTAALGTMFRERKGILSHGKSVTIPIRHTNPDGTVAATMYYHPAPPAPPRPGTT